MLTGSCKSDEWYCKAYQTPVDSVLLSPPSLLKADSLVLYQHMNSTYLTPAACRRYEMVFEYTPLTDCVSESFWVFSIPGQAIHVPFLLVGLVSEPRVMFDVPAINFGQAS